MITVATLLAIARSWIDTPYHHQGRIKGVGVDCIGLIIGIAQDIGVTNIDRPEFRAYGRRPPRGRGMLRYFDEMATGKSMLVDPGRIAVFFFDEATKRAQHIGITTDVGILHTYSSMGRVVEHNLTQDWISKLICTYDFPGVTY